MLSNYDLALALAELEADTSDQVGNATFAGRWLQVALAAEQLAGVSTSANSNINGYMLRAAVALETIAGTTGAEENRTRSGLLKRIVDALEVQAGQVYTGSPGYRFRVAAGAALYGPAPTPTLAALTLATPTVVENTAPGATVSAINGKTSGSTLSLTNDASGRFAISGTNLLTGLTNIDYEAATSYNVTVRETLAGATNTPRDTVLAVAVTDVSEGGGLPAFAYETETNTLITAMTATGTTPNARRQYTLNSMIKRLKAAGIWSKLNQLYIIGETEAHWQINVRNPGTNNLTKVGSPTFTANTAVGNGGVGGNYYDTGVALSAISRNDHSFGVYLNTVTTGTAACIGAIDGGSNGLALRVTSTGAIAARSMSASNGETNTGRWGRTGFHCIARSASGTFTEDALGQTRNTLSVASVANVSANTVWVLQLNGSGTAGGSDLSFAFLGTGMTATEREAMHAIITSTVFAIQQGDIEFYESGYAPTNATYDVVVYGGTAQGCVYAYEMARQGKTVAIVGGWRERRLGGMSANGLGAADVRAAGSVAGLPRWMLSRMATIAGSGGFFKSRDFSQVLREMLDPARTNGRAIPVYWSDGITSVGKAGARLTSITTGDGRTFTASYFVDATYEGDLLALAGVTYVTGREAAGSGYEALNGYRGVSTGSGGDAEQFKISTTFYNVDPFITPGVSGSGLIAGVDPTPATVFGAADNHTQAFNFRVTLSSATNKRISFPSTPPPGYNVATYEALLRYFALAPGAVLNDVMKTTALNDGTIDVNAKGGMSTDLWTSGTQYGAAGSYAARETVWKSVENYIRGLFYLLAYDPDPRVPTAVRTEILTLGFDALHYLNQHPNDAYFWPGQLYVREHRRMVGSLVWDGNDIAATDATTPRSTKTIAVASYSMDSHGSQLIVHTSGTKLWVTGNFFEADAGGTDLLSPLPLEIFVPVKAECENLAVTFCTSSTHVAFGSIRMEFSTMVAAQSLAVITKLAIDGGNIALQDVPYATARTAILATPSLSGETTPALPQLN